MAERPNVLLCQASNVDCSEKKSVLAKSSTRFAMCVLVPQLFGSLMGKDTLVIVAATMLMCLLNRAPVCEHGVPMLVLNLVVCPQMHRPNSSGQKMWLFIRTTCEFWMDASVFDVSKYVGRLATKAGPSAWDSLVSDALGNGMSCVRGLGRIGLRARLPDGEIASQRRSAREVGGGVGAARGSGFLLKKPLRCISANAGQRVGSASMSDSVIRWSKHPGQSQYPSPSL